MLAIDIRASPPRLTLTRTAPATTTTRAIHAGLLGDDPGLRPACRHCRAEAVNTAALDELNHAQSMDLLQQVASFDTKPHLILTGGDPLRRADLYEIIDEARRSASPSPSSRRDRRTHRRSP